MSKTETECNKVYRREWTDNNTGYSYKLELIPSFDADLNSPDVIDLPEGIFSKLDFGWAWSDGFYVGNRKPVKLKFDIKMDLLKDNDNFELFAKLLYESSAVCSDVSFALDLKTITKDVFTSNVWILYEDDTGGTSYFPIFLGAQKRFEGDVITAPLYSVEAIEILKPITDQLSMDMMAYMRYFTNSGDYDLHITALYVDQMIGNAQSHYAEYYNLCKSWANICRCHKDNKTMQLWFQSLECFWYLIQYYVNVIYKKFMRQDLNLELPVYYGGSFGKQYYDGINTRDDTVMLVLDNIYMISYVANENDEIIGGALKMLRANYDTITDFLNAWAVQTGSYLKYRFTGADYSAITYGYSFIGLLRSNESTIDKNKIYDFKLKPNAGRVSGISPEYIETKGEDLETSDIIRANTDIRDAPPNSEELEVTAMFSVAPIAADNYKAVENSRYYEFLTKGTRILFEYIEKAYISNQIHELGLFYKDDPFLPDKDGHIRYIATEELFVRLHELVKIDFGQYTFPDEWSGYNYLAMVLQRNFLPLRYNKEDDMEQIFSIQEESANASVMEVAYYTLFNHDGQNEIEFKVRYEDLGNYKQNILLAERDINIDLALDNIVAGMLDSAANSYKITDFKLNLAGENPNENSYVTIKALSKYGS